MAGILTITFDDKKWRAEIDDKLSRAENPRALLAAGGRELANALKQHFRAKDKSDANKLSPRRSHFWLEIAQSVSSPFQSGQNSVTVRISDPRIAQKVFGGTITPKNADALTIPVEERAYDRTAGKHIAADYDRTAGTFEQETGLKLFLIKNGKGKFERAVLAVKEGSGITVEYLLVTSVDQAPDPTALPDEETLKERITDRMQSVLDRQE